MALPIPSISCCIFNNNFFENRRRHWLLTGIGAASSRLFTAEAILLEPIEGTSKKVQTKGCDFLKFVMASNYLIIIKLKKQLAIAKI